LGLIGGSVCKALHAFTDHGVYGCDINSEILDKALAQHVIDGVVTEDCSGFDLIVVSLYPKLTRKWVQENLSTMDAGTIVIDVAGVKGEIPEILGTLCAEKGVHYLATHPMAGKERFGFDASDENLFQGANFILTPLTETPKSVVAQVKNFAHQIGFRRFVTTTPKLHDRMIAYTSQLAHVVASSYVKSPVITLESGFSGGSFHDMTRIATMNEEMWTMLFMENRESLLEELDVLIGNLQDYRTALENADEESLRHLIADGRHRKEENLQRRRNSPSDIELLREISENF
ncbi:MAG: prephenate dehydrogenase, partial [Oscillospiraceae bacterium]|nr:prephenate dehydrogenase [Oscillospiraceae bacterium]